MKLVICDDRPEILSKVRQMILSMDIVACEIETTKMPDTLLTEWKQHPTKIPEILIMDIEFPYLDRSGIEIAKEIQNVFPQIKLIFITGKIQYAQDIFVTQPCAFLVKPIEEKRLKAAIEKACALLEKEKEEILIFKAHGGIVKVPVSTIIYIESVGHNLIVHTEGRNLTFRKKLSECMETIPDDFWLIHQSYVVHAKYIRRIMTSSIEMAGGITLPIARSKYKEIKEKFFDELEKEKQKD